MIELAKSMIGKDCIIYIFNTQISGIIEEVSEGAILLKTGKNGENKEVINIDYVMRIREYPLDKKGKKKSVVLD